MPRYVPKMHEIEAFSLKHMMYWDYSMYPNWVREMLNTDDIVTYKRYVIIHTCEGVKTLDYYGYIFKDENGLIYAMDEKEFLDKYELVKEGGKNG